MKRLLECAECGREIDDDYVSYMDNFLQREYFNEEDGSDNIFCSVECAATALMLGSRRLSGGNDIYIPACGHPPLA